MIPVQPGHSLWTWPYSNSCGWFCSWCCSDSTLLLSWGATNTEIVAASTKFPRVWNWRHVPDSSGSSGSLSESLKYLGYRPQALLLNHNIGSPDICLHGNSQSMSTESAVHIECQRATMIIQFLNYWCQTDMKRREECHNECANKQKTMILLPYLSYSVNICASVAPEI